jgi:hypothetical protein
MDDDCPEADFSSTDENIKTNTASLDHQYRIGFTHPKVKNYRDRAQLAQELIQIRLLLSRLKFKALPVV